MSRRAAVLYAVVGLVLLVWWGFAQSVLTAVLVLGLAAVAAVHALDARRHPAGRGVNVHGIEQARSRWPDGSGS